MNGYDETNQQPNGEMLPTAQTQKPARHKYTKLRKMLSTAALSAALISWYTTANGLHEYVFSQIWHAYVISAALQGALFALSIKGIDIFFSFKHRKVLKRIGLVTIWSLLLLSSSIFSYVHISADVYSDQLLMEDAHHILSTYSLSENYKMSARADELLNGEDGHTGIWASMNNYVNQLSLLENGIDLSEDGSDEKLTFLKNSLLTYAYIYNTQPGSTSPVAEISECVDTSYLVTCLDILLTGQYTEQSVKDVETESTKLILAVEAEIARAHRDIDTKIGERDEYQNRLKTYSNVNSPAYLSLTNDLNGAIKEIEALENLVTALGVEKANLETVPGILSAIQNSMVSVLHDKVLQIRSAMNAEQIDTNDVQRVAEEIYDALLENSAAIGTSDPRLTGYAGFRSDLAKYSAIIEATENINAEVEALYDLPGVSELSADGTDAAKWTVFWQDHLNSLRKSAQRLQAGGLEETVIVNLIAELEEYERLYLSDLNDFERAWDLLFSNHPYKALLKFSVVFAFGIDLFAVAMSILLYLFKTKRNISGISGKVSDAEKEESMAAVS